MATQSASLNSMKPSVDAELQKLRCETFAHFLHETNPANGLVINKTAPDWPSSIAATGLALACYPVSIERGFMSRAAAVKRTLATLRFFWNSTQGPEPDASGYKGFYYHFMLGLGWPTHPLPESSYAAWASTYRWERCNIAVGLRRAGFAGGWL